MSGVEGDIQLQRLLNFCPKMFFCQFFPEVSDKMNQVKSSFSEKMFIVVSKPIFKLCDLWEQFEPGSYFDRRI